MVICSAAAWVGVDIVSCLLLVAVWLIVPAGLRIACPPTDNWQFAGIAGAGDRLVGTIFVGLPIGAMLASVALLSAPSVAATILSAGWAAICLAIGAVGLLRILQRGLGPSEELAADTGLIFAAVGGGWLFVSRLPVEPTGFGRLLAQLTAAHFQVGGVTLGAGLAGLGRVLELDTSEGLSSVHALGTGAFGVGFLLVAAGISGLRPLELTGTLILAVSVLVLVGFALRATPVAVRRSRWAGLGLPLASISAGVGIAFAGVYAWGRWPGPATVSIPTMIRWHATVNTVGFSLPLLAALIRLSPEPTAPEEIPFSDLAAIDGRTGADFFERAGALSDRHAPESVRGFVADMDVFDRGDFPTGRLHPAVRSFYERTDDYRIRVRPEWQAGWRWAGRLWHRFVESLGQLRLPVGGTGSEARVESRVVALSAEVDGRRSPRGWVRSYTENDEAMYVAAYSTHSDGARTYMNIAFPWWCGNLTSVLVPTPLAIGDPDHIGVRLHTLDDPRGGDQGVYAVHNTGARPRRVRLPLDESIAVWPVDAPDPPVEIDAPADAVALARHDMWFCGLRYLELDYVLLPKTSVS